MRAIRRTPRQVFRERTGRDPGKVGRFSTAPAPVRSAFDVAGLDHYWHPQRAGVEPAPEWFADRLTAIHPDLAVVRPPAGAPVPRLAWLVWMRKPSVTHRLCPGWWLLFVWETPGRLPLPLDNRVFANLYLRSRERFGSAVQYWDHCQRQMDAEKATREKDYTRDRQDQQREFVKARRISNLGSGSKFAQHHDGTIVPSRASAAWSTETRARRLPSEMLREERETRERQRDSR